MPFTKKNKIWVGRKHKESTLVKMRDGRKLMFAIDNGITLSEKAHKEFHKRYGRVHNTREQLIEYLH